MDSDATTDGSSEIIDALRPDRLLGRLIDDLPDIVLVLDPDGRLLHVNRACTELLGWQVDELVFESILETVHPDDVERVVGALATVGEQSDGALEIRSRARDGSHHWYSWRAARLDGIILAIGRDATAQRTMYEELAERTAFIDSVLHTLLSGVITTDDVGTILSTNPAATEMFGYEPDELLGRDVSFLMDTADASQHGHFMERFATSGESAIVGTRQTLSGRLGRRKDGTTFPVGIEISTFESKGARFFTGVVTDLTELTNAFGELEAARIAADAAYRQKASLLAQVSHELRTPLNAVLGFSELLEIDDDGTHAGAISAIRDGGLQLRHMIDDILELNETGATPPRGREEPVAVDDMIAGKVAALSVADPGRIAILPAGDEALIVFVDRERLREILRRALTFALAAASDTSTVTIGARRSTGGTRRCRIEVSIPGLDIPPDRRRDLFEPFGTRRAHEPAHRSERGLGLAIAGSEIRAMGGTVGVDTHGTDHTTVWFELPLAEGSTGEDDPAVS